MYSLESCGSSLTFDLRKRVVVLDVDGEVVPKCCWAFNKLWLLASDGRCDDV